MTLLIDMNLSPLWVDFLGAAGIEAAHWTSVGERDALDTEILAYAAAEEAEMEQGALLTIEPGRARMRLLPLRPEESAVE